MTRMSVRNLLLVYKKSARWDSERFKAAHQAHVRTLDKVRCHLRRRGIRFKAVYRARFVDYAPYEGVISVGGDGTFLEAAHRIRNQWILGVNSDPERSAGSFCGADGSNVEKILDRILKNGAKIQRLQRVQLELNGKRLGVPVLNDILITHRKPAAMSRYRIQLGRMREEQRSSGLWISTAAGSTGAIRSAGGRKLPRGSKGLQYRPRELYRKPGFQSRRSRFRYRLTGGEIPPNRPVRISSLMREGLICVDGEHWTFPFRYGDRLSIRPFPYPLRVIR